MAANTYVTIDEVVNDAALMMGDDSYMSGVKNYQLRTLALQGLKELSFDMLQEIRSVQLTVSSSGTLTLPDDYIKYTKIGILGSDDRVHFIGKQDNLNLVAGASSDTSSGIDDDPAYFFGVGGRFGVGGGTNHHGYYRVNKEDNTISFSSKLVGKKVILEYISNSYSNLKQRVYNLTVGTDGSAIVDESSSGNSEISLPAFYDGFGTENLGESRFKILFNTSTSDVSTNSVGSNKTVIIYQTSDTTAQIADRIKKCINDESIHHSATSTGNVVTITYNKDFNWTLSELIGNMTGTSGSASETPSGQKVHQFAEEALRSYIYWKSLQRRRGVPFGEKQLAKRDFFNEKRLANARMKSFTKDEAMMSSRKAYKQSPKI